MYTKSTAEFARRISLPRWYENRNIEQRIVDAANAIVIDYEEGYLCDVIAEVTDNYTPIYTGEILEAAYDLNDKVGECCEEGLIDTGSFVSLEKMLQIAYFYEIESVLYDNIENLIFNIGLNAYCDFSDEFPNIEPGSKSEKAIIDKIDEFVDSYDNNSQIEDIRAHVRELMQIEADKIFEEVLKNKKEIVNL